MRLKVLMLLSIMFFSVFSVQCASYLPSTLTRSTIEKTDRKISATIYYVTLPRERQVLRATHYSADYRYRTEYYSRHDDNYKTIRVGSKKIEVIFSNKLPEVLEEAIKESCNFTDVFYPSTRGDNGTGLHVVNKEGTRNVFCPGVRASDYNMGRNYIVPSESVLTNKCNTDYVILVGEILKFRESANWDFGFVDQKFDWISYGLLPFNLLSLTLIPIAGPKFTYSIDYAVYNKNGLYITSGTVEKTGRSFHGLGLVFAAPFSSQVEMSKNHLYKPAKKAIMNDLINTVCRGIRR